MRLGARGRLRPAELKRAAREAGLAAGEAAVAWRDDDDGFGPGEVGGVGALPATSMVSRSMAGWKGERLDVSRAVGDADVVES